MTRLRPLRPDDQAAIAEIHRRQNERLPASQRWGLPPLESPLTVAAWVAETNGKTDGALVCRATTEMFFVATSPAIVRAAIGGLAEIEQALARASVEDVHSFLPRHYLRGMTPLMTRLGFRAYNPEYAVFYREIP